MENHPVESIMDTTLEHIKEMVDVDTVVGKPVFSENGTIIIPLSKLGVGFVAGGAQYGENQKDQYPFGGGGAAGISVSPCGFLVINNGVVSFLSAQKNDGLDKVMNNVPQIIREIKTTLMDLDVFGDSCEDEDQDDAFV